MSLHSAEEILHYENWDLENITTPVDMKVLHSLLVQSNYNEQKTKYVIDGFRNGFSIGYEGDEQVKRNSQNLKFSIGNETILWNKVMKEVKLKRFTGPYEQIPFEHYIQSPIGLVPKDGGRETRLIFHLSYPRNSSKGKKLSVNANTPQEICKVKYCDFDMAIHRCIEEGKNCSLSKSDFKSAFRNLRVLKKHWKWLVMKAKDPETGLWYFFIDKCLSFGTSISCTVFQAVSDAIAHIMWWRTGKKVVNYLDDFLFIALLKMLCKMQLDSFMELCKSINFLVALEKTCWPTTQLVFLGLLIDIVNQIILLPIEKIERGKTMIKILQERKSKKVTLKELQQLCGFLNFLGKAIVPGRAFTRRLYYYT